VSVLVIGGLWAIDARLGAVGGVELLGLGLGLPALTVFFTRGPHTDQVRRRAELDVHIADGLHGLPDLLVCGQAGRQVQRMLDVAELLAQSQKRLATVAGLRLAGHDAIARLGAWSVLLLAIPLVAADGLGAASLAVLAVVLLAAAEALEPLAQSAHALAGTHAAARRMWEIADLPPALTFPPDLHSPRPLPDGQGARARLEFCGVGFTYDGPIVLSDVSFVLRPGHAIGVVGASGGGKSTLLSLGARAWDPIAGQVQLDGRDLRTESAEAVTRRIGLLTQDSYIFSGTLRENLRLGRSSATERELKQALQAVGLNETLRQLPEGLDSWLGDQGARLSGGERRLLALARLLLRDVSFLLLDEPTANLDPITERAIMRVIRAASRTRGILLVTHRLVDLDWLDELLVLDAGYIVERGRHADLRRARGLYERMVDVQEALLADA
jgi:ATP-binding cassette subfamily C protein CydC